MKRLLIVYNTHSSRFSDVEKEVLARLKNLKGFLIGKYEVEPTDVDKNAKKLSKLLRDGDLVVAAGGDATAAIAVNAILDSEKDISFSALPYGNFNDLSRTLGLKTLDEVLATQETKQFYPLEIHVDDKFFRFSTCYVTIGMTAEAVKIYDYPGVRKTLKNSAGRSVGSYLTLMAWYFKNHRKKDFLPAFKLNGKKSKPSSDYAAMNGRFMARVMKGGDDFLDPEIFRSEIDLLTKFYRLVKLMLKSILIRTPGSETKGDLIEFLAPATVDLQAEGEFRTFSNIKKIEIKKSKKYLKVICKGA